MHSWIMLPALHALASADAWHDARERGHRSDARRWARLIREWWSVLESGRGSLRALRRNNALSRRRALP